MFIFALIITLYIFLKRVEFKTKQMFNKIIFNL